MFNRKSRYSIVAALVAVLATQLTGSLAADDMLELNHSSDLRDFKGSTFLEAMTREEIGLKAMMDADGVEKFKIANWKRVKEVKDYFAPIVYSQVVRVFKDKEDGLKTLVDTLAGRAVTPVSIVGAIASELQAQGLVRDPSKIGLNAVQVAPFLTLVSGGGTAVHIDDTNMFYNVGYKPGSDDPEVLAKHVKSGRSFGVAPGHWALDSSDVEYLTILEEYVDGAEDTTDFYAALIRTLVSCDTAGFRDLSDLGQDVATDFITVYTAEIDRFIMTGLTKHPWMNDLAEATFISAFAARADIVRKDGQIVEGAAKDWFGVGTGGTGIGITRKDRQALQREASKFMREEYPELVGEIEAIIGHPRDGDVMHGFMTFINEPRNQAKVKKNAKALVAKMSEFLATLTERAEDIREYVLH